MMNQPKAKKSGQQLLQEILRGISRLGGCNSANLIMLDPQRNLVRVEAGVSEIDYPLIGEMKKLLGISLEGIQADLDQTRESLLVRSWRENRAYESSKLVDIIGEALPRQLVEKFQEMIGEHSFYITPVGAGLVKYGVLVFEKPGCGPFSLQQKELMLRYARRLGEIIESGLSIPDNISELFSSVEDQLETMLVQLALSQQHPIIYLDPHLKVTSGNEAIARQLGLEVDQLSKVNLNDVFLEPQKLTQAIREQDLFSSEGKSQELPLVIRDRRGTLQLSLVDFLPLISAQRRVVGYIVLLKMQDEQSGRGSSTDLKRLSTLAEMAAQLAHEIRNPLIAIGVALRELQRRLESQMRPQVQEIIDEIGRLDQILRKYLSPPSSLNLRRIHLRSVVENTLILLGQQWDRQRVRIEIPDNLHCQADEDALRQIIYNLLLNSYEAGKGRAQITIRCQQISGSLRIIVEDNGPGLQASPQDCLRPFFTTKAHGSGLGLSVCSKLAQAHGGVIWISNKSGGGCQVEITLPQPGNS
jgi:signal transduction histidine kinase